MADAKSVNVWTASCARTRICAPQLAACVRQRHGVPTAEVASDEKVKLLGQRNETDYCFDRRDCGDFAVRLDRSLLRTAHGRGAWAISRAADTVRRTLPRVDTWVRGFDPRLQAAARLAGASRGAWHAFVHEQAQRALASP